jgi:hypothetical protein
MSTQYKKDITGLIVMDRSESSANLSSDFTMSRL